MEELHAVKICDICSEEESGVSLHSGASFVDGFPTFHGCSPAGRSCSDGNRECFRTASSPPVSPCNRARVPHGSPDEGVHEDDLKASRASSVLDCLLVELYDTYSSSFRSVDSSTEASGSDAFLGRSNTASSFLQELQEKHTRRHQMKYLSQKDLKELKWIVQEVKCRIAVQSAKLLRQLKRKDRLRQRFQKKCDIVSACLQAVSQKRRVDTRLKFTIEPSLGKNSFQQWYDALKAVARLPAGIPKEWRKRVWLTLADQYLHSISIDWEKTMRFAFNERSNPDDDSLGIQIVKDLHRTGCSSYCGQEGEPDRVVLKRVLLAYARWNKTVGYCQGFNVLAALILEVTEGNEGDALKVMIYLIDKVLPDSYFANNLRALSVDMAVFRDLLRLKLPELSQHLHHLQKAANRDGGGSYEPPLTNVFTMQWFLTMFATCLPHHTVLKIWDLVFFEGSEILLRVALAIWAKLGERIEECQTADEFYSTMGSLTQEMLEHNLIESNGLMQTICSMAPFPFPQLSELREKYTYNITPFPAPVRANSSQALHGWESDDDDGDMDDEDPIVTALGCLGPLGGLLAPEIQRYQKHLKDQRAAQSFRGSNIAELSPGAVGAGRSEHQASVNSMMQERMSTDINALQKQYTRIKQKQQQQAGLLYIHTGFPSSGTPGPPVEAAAAGTHNVIKPEKQHTDKCPATSLLASQLGPSPVVNHLLLGRKPRSAQRSSKNGFICNGEANLVPQDHSSPSHGQTNRARLHSPWRAHVRTHRRNLARARAQLGFDDSLELEDSETPLSQTDEVFEEAEWKKSEEEGVEDKGDDQETVSEEQEKVEQKKGVPESLEVSLQDQSSGEDEKVQQMENQLSSLELEPSSEPTSPNSNDPEPSTASPPPEPRPNWGPSPTAPSPLASSCRPGLDSSSSESGGSLTRSSSTLEEPVKPQQIFSPFPCIKTPRKSIAARNLGLYGPTSRTPNVNFPQMSRSMNRVGSTIKRR